MLGPCCRAGRYPSFKEFSRTGTEASAIICQKVHRLSDFFAFAGIESLLYPANHFQASIKANSSLQLSVTPDSGAQKSLEEIVKVEQAASEKEDKEEKKAQDIAQGRAGGSSQHGGVFSRIFQCL